MVILDRVVATKAEYEKTWLLHMTNEPELEGRTALITNGPGRLSLQTLLPQAARLEKIEGYSYGGLDFPAKQNRHHRNLSPWRLEVKPAEPQAEDLFLHVLCTDGTPEATLLQADAMVALRVGEDEVEFTGLGGLLKRGGRELPLRAEVRVGPYEG